MIFPIGDTQVQGGYKPIFSYSFIAINIIVFGLQLISPGQLVCELSVIPQEILEGNRLYTLLTSMFLHSGYMHLIGNMLFLWIFGDNIEATIGNIKFLIYYLFGGIFASIMHIYFAGMDANLLDCCVPCQNSMVDCGQDTPPCEGYIPSLGASGAISALMGGYMMLFPKSKIKVLVLIFFKSFYISAWIFLLLWFGQQILSGIGSELNISGTEGVAWWAHIGGFVIGLLMAWVYKMKNKTKDEFV